MSWGYPWFATRFHHASTVLSIVYLFVYFFTVFGKHIEMNSFANICNDKKMFLLVLCGTYYRQELTKFYFKFYFKLKHY